MREAYRQLVATLLLHAIEDAKGYTGNARGGAAEAIRFASSPWCEALCDYIGLDYPAYLKTMQNAAQSGLSRQKRLVLPV